MDIKPTWVCACSCKYGEVTSRKQPHYLCLTYYRHRLGPATAAAAAASITTQSEMDSTPPPPALVLLYNVPGINRSRIDLSDRSAENMPKIHSRQGIGGNCPLPSPWPQPSPTSKYVKRIHPIQPCPFIMCWQAKRRAGKRLNKRKLGVKQYN